MSEAARASPVGGRYRRGVLVATGVCAVLAAGACHLQQAEMATRVKKKVVEEEEEGDVAERCRRFMSPPVTEARVLEERKHEMRSRMEMLIMETQAEFCRALQEVDGGTFKVDRWSREEGTVLCWVRVIQQHPPPPLLQHPLLLLLQHNVCVCVCVVGGGGISCVLQDSKVFEKAGVNVSVVSGHLSEEAAKQMRSRGKELKAKDGEVMTSCSMSVPRAGGQGQTRVGVTS